MVNLAHRAQLTNQESSSSLPLNVWTLADSACVLPPGGGLWKHKLKSRDLLLLRDCLSLQWVALLTPTTL